MNANDTNRTVAVLNRLLEAELAGVVRYTHYSFLVFGFGRIPIVSWLRGQATESLAHAQMVGDWITTLGAYPSLAIGPLLDSHQTDIGAMLRESLQAEGAALALYREFRSRGIHTRQRPFVGNRLWVVPLSDPDGYRIDFESPTDAPEETELEE